MVSRHDDSGSPTGIALLEHDCRSSDASFPRSFSDQWMPAARPVPQPRTRSRSTSGLVFSAACVCALVLGAYLGRLSRQPWNSQLLQIRRRAAADSVRHSSGTVSPAANPAERSRGNAASMGEEALFTPSSSDNRVIGSSDDSVIGSNAEMDSSSMSRKTTTDVSAAGSSGGGGGKAGSMQQGSKKRRRRGARLSSRRVVCREFPLQRRWDWKVHLNPAAVYDPKRGWLVVMRHEHEWWAPSPALAVMMGTDVDAPDVGFAADHQFLLELDNATLGSEFAQQRYSKQWLKAEDIRPFVWKSGVYATASVWGEDSSFVWECILRLDLDAHLLTAEFCFDKMPIRTNVTTEKNWAVVVRGDAAQEVMILHQLAPCLVWLRFAPAAPKGLELVQGTCFSDKQRAAVQDFTGAPLTEAQHISGHLVPFPRSLAKLDALRRNLAVDSASLDTTAAAAAAAAEAVDDNSSSGGGGGSGGSGKGGSRKQQRSELFLMAHTRHADGQEERDVYSHWGFRFDADSLQLTHVSRGPIVSSYMAPQPHNYLVVLSYHFVRSDGADALLLFYGRNNTQSCFDTIAAETVSWYEVPPGGETAMNISDPQSIGYEL